MFQPTMVYSVFLIKENVGSFKYNIIKSTQIILTFLIIFEWSKVSTINVRNMKKSYKMIYHNKDAKGSHFRCLPRMLARSSLIIKKNLRLLTHVGFFRQNGLILSEVLLYMERSKNHEKKIYHNRAKKFTFLRRFDCEKRFLEYREI